ncbi:MAG: DUF72 domain-containing protein [Deltaproteobacteria bacterium]|nr:DUF72 domain-containing protein [Deltaproteobacteria bacterium]
MTIGRNYRVGCSGIPAGLRRTRYFEKLGFLECPETYAAPPRTKVLRSWGESAPEGGLGLIASRVITQSVGSSWDELPEEQWPEAGGFRDTGVIRAAVGRLKEQVSATGASTVLFRSAPDLARSAEARLRTFFTDIASQEAIGGAVRIWEPGELWETTWAVKLAEELDLVLAIDPLAESHLGGSALRPVDQLPDQRPVYLRIRGLGRARKSFRDHEIEEVAEIAMRFPSAWVVFCNQDKNRDAKKLLELLSAAS